MFLGLTCRCFRVPFALGKVTISGLRARLSGWGSRKPPIDLLNPNLNSSWRSWWEGAFVGLRGVLSVDSIGLRNLYYSKGKDFNSLLLSREG